MLRSLPYAFGVTVALFFCQSVIAGGIPESSDVSAPANSVPTSSTQTTTSQSQTSTTSGQSTKEQDASGAAFVAIEDDPLIVDVSDIADSDGMGTSQIQWQISRDGKNWLNLSGAVQQSFTPREADVDQYLRVVISVTTTV